MYSVVYSKNESLGIRRVVHDLLTGLLDVRVWSAFAWEEIKNRYRRSVFGLLWIVFSYVIFVAGLAVFFGGFSDLDSRKFVVYVALGFIPYQFVISNVSEASTVFVNSSNWIRSIRLPYSVYIYIAISKTFLPAILQMCAGAVIISLMGWRPTILSLLAIPAFLLLVFNVIWIQLFLGIVGARFRDLQHFVNSITRILFFMTPIMWIYEERTGLVKFLADLNPLTHLLAIFRDPLLGEWPSALNYWAVGGFTLFGWILAIGTAAVFQRRLPLWVI